MELADFSDLAQIAGAVLLALFSAYALRFMRRLNPLLDKLEPLVAKGGNLLAGKAPSLKDVFGLMAMKVLGEINIGQVLGPKK